MVDILRQLSEAATADDELAYINSITPLAYYRMDYVERFAITTKLAILEYQGVTTSIEHLERLEHTRTAYKYEYTVGEDLVRFKTAKEVADYFGCNICRVWTDCKNGKIPGVLQRVNKILVTSRDGTILDEIVKKVPAY